MIILNCSAGHHLQLLHRNRSCGSLKDMLPFTEPLAHSRFPVLNTINISACLWYVAGGMFRAHLLVLGGGDLLQEVGNALALGQLEAKPREEGQYLITRPMKHHMPCMRSKWDDRPS